VTAAVPVVHARSLTCPPALCWQQRCLWQHQLRKRRPPSLQLSRGFTDHLNWAAAAAAMSGAVKGRIMQRRWPSARLLEKCAVLLVPVAAYKFLPHFALHVSALTIGTVAVNEVVKEVVGSIYIPVVGILFAVLVTSAMDRLWDRQREIKSVLLEEATLCAELVRSALQIEHERTQQGILQLANQYMCYLTHLLNGERDDLHFLKWDEDVELETHRDDHPLYGIRQLIGDLCAQRRHDKSEEAGDLKCDDHAANLITLRAKRTMIQEERMPFRLWAIMYSLGISLASSFVLAAAGPGSGAACSSWRVRALFALMCGSFTALHCLMTDLADPFKGSFSIASSSSRTIRFHVLAPAKVMLKRALHKENY